MHPVGLYPRHPNDFSGGRRQEAEGKKAYTVSFKVWDPEQPQVYTKKQACEFSGTQLREANDCCTG